MPDESTSQESQSATARSDPEFWIHELGGPASARWLIQDPEVDALIRAERPRDLYRLLQKRLRQAPGLTEKEALERVLANRRLFLEPIQDGPRMQTINGIGTRLSGAQDRAPDGTYIGTLFFTLLFLPFWPIRQYLVANAENGGWYFIGRVPTSNRHRWWRRALVAAAATTAVGIGLSIHYRVSHDEVYFLNGLDEQVRITVGDHSLTVPARGREQVELAEGAYHLATRLEDGTVIEELDVRVPGNVDVVAYNVLGAAPLFFQTVPYTADADDEALARTATTFRSLAGRAWVLWDDVDFVFVTPPTKVQMPTHKSIVTRTHVDVADGGWHTTVQHLAGGQKLSEAAATARKVVRTRPGDLDAAGLAAQLAEMNDDVTGARSVLEDLLAAAPDSVDAHRFFQSHMENHGSLVEILPRYRAAYERDPQSPHEAYLYARLLPIAEALPILNRLLPTNPDDRWLRRGVAWGAFQQARFEDAVGHYRKLAELTPEERGAAADYLARALAAIGRPEEALAYVGDLLRAAPARLEEGRDPLRGGDTWDLLLLYASLRRMTEASDTGPPVREVWTRLTETAEPMWEAFALLGAAARDEVLVQSIRSNVLDPGTKRLVTIALLSQTDAARAAALAAHLAPQAFQRLDPLARLAVACELERTGNEEQARAALEGFEKQHAELLPFTQVQALPNLEGVDENLDIELKAVLIYAASRRVTDGEEKEALLSEARKLDVLKRVLPD